MKPVPDRDPIAEARRQWVAHGWTESADGMEAVTTITRVQQILQAEVDSTLRPYGLTFARFELLRLLAFTRTGSLPLGKVSARLQVHAASVTSAVDRLVADGLVERVRNPNDGRSFLASITSDGRTLAEEATADLNKGVFEGVGLTSEEFGMLRTVLGKLGCRVVPHQG